MMRVALLSGVIEGAAGLVQHDMRWRGWSEEEAARGYQDQGSLLGLD
jgi:hypothetical protein